MAAAWLWDARTGQARGGPMKHDDEVYAVAFSPDGQRVLTGSLEQHGAAVAGSATGGE